MGKKTGRHRRHIPYGSKGYCGYGGETYSKKHGTWIDDVVDKRAYRQRVREILRKKKERYRLLSLSEILHI